MYKELTTPSARHGKDAAINNHAPAALRLPTIAAAEWYFPAGVALLLLLITAIPWAYAWLSTPPDKQFMGILLNVPDHIQYFSWMRELATANLSANKLTPEPNAPVFFNLLWWGMARAGTLLGVDYAGMFQVLRWVATLICLPLIYLMVAWFLEPKLWRRTAFLVIVLGGGLGWLLVVGKYTVMAGKLLWPLDLYVVEPNTFFAILASPHFVGALIYIGVFDLFLRGLVLRQWRYPVLAGLLALFLGWQHAYDLLIVYAVIGVWTLLVWLQEKRFPTFAVLACVIVGAISVTPAIYSVLLTSLDPLWAEVLAQFANAGVFTPPLYRLPILLGIPFVIALYEAIRQHPWRVAALPQPLLLLQGWFWIYFLLVYLRTDYQIHMLNGWQIPIGILATLTLFTRIVPWLKQHLGGAWGNRLVRWAPLLLILAIIPTNLYLYMWRISELRRHDAPYYLHVDEVQALTWLRDNAAPSSVVMAPLKFGQYVPALAGTHAFIAHWAQTVDYYGKQELVAEYYNVETPTEDRTRILDEYSVDYVVFDRETEQLDATQVADSAKLVYESPDQAVQVYAVGAVAQE